jgi:phytoene desaturase
MSKAGYDVSVLEKHDMPGGRARMFQEDGFTFDMGPSWYWMPDVFEHFFNCFGKKVSDYYQLTRLDPSYKIYWAEGMMNVPASYNALRQLFEEKEPGSSKALDKFMREAACKYETGINKLVYKPGRSLTEFLDWDLVKSLFKLDVFTSIKTHISKYFKHPELRQLLEFPVLFLGALPQDTPALYSLMNYADIKLGTWYPEKGMYSIVKAMYDLARKLGVKFYFNHTVQHIKVENNAATTVFTETINGEKVTFQADAVIGGADYNFIETHLLEKQYRTYTDIYWNKKVMAPSCLIFYIGLNKRLQNITHHSLFFDVDFELHGKEIYTDPQWPAEPLFYVCAPSVTDNTVAPEGCENLFFLIPVASGLTGDTEALREKYFDKILKRFEQKIGQSVKQEIIYKRSYSVSNFISDYNSFKGNAYGLANTLMQTAILKPSIKSKKVKNLFYTGQLTVPGPGVPPSIISGEVVSKEVIKYFS